MGFVDLSFRLLSLSLFFLTSLPSPLPRRDFLPVYLLFIRTRAYTYTFAHNHLGGKITKNIWNIQDFNKKFIKLIAFAMQNKTF